VLDDRLAGRVDDSAAGRAFDEINEFEAQQLDAGTLLAKLFFTVEPQVQKERLARQRQSPWHRDTRGDPLILADDPYYGGAFDELCAHTDTRWSPWAMIDGSDESAAAKAALEALCDSWAKGFPAEPAHLVEGKSAA
jgi:AMP-polyphosphate phosphotransferase